MTHLDEPVRPADVLAAALLTIRAHEGRRRCVNCPAEGPCRGEWWAVTETASRSLAPTDPLRPTSTHGNPQ